MIPFGATDVSPQLYFSSVRRGLGRGDSALWLANCVDIRRIRIDVHHAAVDTLDVFSNINYNLLFLLVMSSLMVYGLILAG